MACSKRGGPLFPELSRELKVEKYVHQYQLSSSRGEPHSMVLRHMELDGRLPTATCKDGCCMRVRWRLENYHCALQ